MSEEKVLAPEATAPVADEALSVMFKAGVHIGHVPSKTHPKMAHFIYASRNGTAMFDLHQTQEALERAGAFLAKMISEGKTALLVGTKPAAQATIQKIHAAYGTPVVIDRWVGGTLTNWKVIASRIQELDRLQREKAEGGFRKYTKKEALRKEEEIERLEKTFGGIKTLKRIPDILIAADADEDELAIKEAARMHIPTIAIVNSNRNPDDVAYAIPANDNSISSVAYILGQLEKAIREGQTRAAQPAETAEQTSQS